MKAIVHSCLMAVVAFCLIICVSTSAFANSFGINLYGMSYHFLEAQQSRDFLNEFNSGFGARASFGSKNGNTFLIEAGTFKDTFKNKAKYIAVGYKLRFVAQLRAGVIGAMYTTQSIRHGGSLALVPILSYTVWRVSLNGVYLPRYEDVNPYHILGAYLTIHLFAGEPTKSPRR